LRGERRVLAAVRTRPRQAHPAAGRQLPLPRLAMGELVGAAHVVARADGGVVVGQVLGEPRPDLLAEDLVLGGEGEVHRRYSLTNAGWRFSRKALTASSASAVMLARICVRFS